ncbi:MAG: aminotransferase class V-fold PLP-dependent enzyme [Acidobacteria bacterium]|nr:aminotransferase class V-fold PLP-dependent enzyme [Acidobacteriota bacterium]
MKPVVSRRAVFQTAAAASWLAAPAAAAPPPKTGTPDVYTRIGARPFINMTATYTINGGAPMHPEVKQAMEEASQWAVNLDELMEKAGARIAELLGAEAAIVSAGCASALCHATAAAIAGNDPEKMKQLPHSDGLRNEVLIARQSRNDYDHAFRTAGGRLVEYDAREQFFASLGRRTALVAVLGTAEAKGKLRLEEIAEAAHKAGVPVIVDAAAELPLKPNPFLSRGADLVAYSGGKILRGPQSAGLLLGRKDLVRAAWWNSSPHHAYGRAMKVSKEEICGMVTAVEIFVERGLENDYRVWESWLEAISAGITKVAGVTTRMLPPAGASPFPVMDVSWDPDRIGLAGEQVHRLLLDGEPRIMSHAGGEATSFLIRPVALKPEHPPMISKRLTEIFRSAPRGIARPAAAPPSTDLAGSWDVVIEFSYGRTRHTLLFEPVKGSQLKGVHVGLTARSRLRGTIDGSRVSFRSALPVEGMHLSYRFTGAMQADAMSGDLDLGEFGQARWSAKRTEG